MTARSTPMPRIVKLYYTDTLDAAHSLPGYDGDCAKVHGHTWKVEVWLRGYVDLVTGMVLDFRYIQNVLDDYDHLLLNDILSMPTAENIALRLQRDLPLAYRIRVWESDHSYAEVERTYEDRLQSLPQHERDRLTQGCWAASGRATYTELLKGRERRRETDELSSV